jgi:Trypsin-like peptidase domain
MRWVVVIGLFLPVSAWSAPMKSFGVFIAAYNSSGSEARGGIAGTAFFVSPNRAITAFHVLKPTSLKPAGGFERIRIWLVHENEPAIEVRPEYLHYSEDKDLTEINFPSLKAKTKYVFESVRNATVGASVETEGFLANSVGPVLQRFGSDLEIISVPHLERMELRGNLTRTARVSLEASDIHLHEIPCLQADYTPIVGFSGGPVVYQGKVIGMNSFADPNSRKSTWAVAF